MDPSGPDRREKASGKSWSKDLGPFLTLGLQLAASVVVCFFLGRWLDGVFHTEPWLMLAGLLFGTVAGLYNFLKAAVTAGKKADREAADRKKDADGAH